MNKTYRVIRNKSTGLWMVASEIACGRGKGRTASMLLAASLLGGGFMSAPSVHAQTANGGLQLCDATTPANSTGSGSNGSGKLSCTSTSASFSLNNYGDTNGLAGFSASTTLSRTAFGIGAKTPAAMVGDEVNLTVDLDLVKQ